MKYNVIKKEEKKRKVNYFSFGDLNIGYIFRLKTGASAFVYMKVDCRFGEEVSNAIRMMDGKLFYFDLSEHVYLYNGIVEFDEDCFTDTWVETREE